MINVRKMMTILAVLLFGVTGGMAQASEMSTPADIQVRRQPIPTSEALAFTSGLKAGWNLGNTFDAANCDWLADPLLYETAWCGSITRPELFDLLAELGFAAVRIPVSWHNHVSGAEFTIDEQWLARVQEVAGYALERGLYVILNTHHDMDPAFLYPDQEHLESSLRYIGCVWPQLAEAFRDTDEHLIFEGMNEPRLVGTELEWYANPKDERTAEAVRCINALNQAFVDTVRASGGQNASRYLMVPGYGASLDGALNSGFSLPADSVEGRIILSVHAYTPYDFALRDPADPQSRDAFDAANDRDRAEIDCLMNTLYRNFIQKGIPVVLGEYGARNKNGNLEARTAYTAYFTAAATACGIPCFLWDNAAFMETGSYSVC